MKLRILVVLLAVCSIASAQITNPAPYCQYQFDDGTSPQVHYISSVTVGAFTNVTGTVQQPAPHYIYYNNLSAITVVQGSTYNLAVTTDTLGSDRSIYIFIDWDRNGSFTGLEYYGTSLPLSGADSVFAVAMSVPMSAGIGITRMRVTVNEDGSGTIIGFPCMTALDWGEAEDYDVNITTGTGVEKGSQNTINIYPTVVEDKLTIKSESEIQSVVIYNVSGEMVLERSINGEKKIDLALNTIPHGIYFLQALRRFGITTIKFVKN